MDGQYGTTKGVPEVSDKQSQEGTHPALRTLVHVLHAFGDCIKELEETENVLKVENLALQSIARNAWREELQLMTTYTREQLTHLTSEVQEKVVSLIDAEGHNVPLSPESKGTATSSIMMEYGDSSFEASSRHDDKLQWCQHTCANHGEIMDPSLWGKLPEYIVELIFAWLPLNKIVQLQNLSKHWKQAVRYSMPFRQACTKINLKMFAVITSNQRRDCKIHLCDVKERKWFLKTMDAVSYGFWASPVAAAGGLLCIIDLHKLSYGALSILICNPLTNQTRVLPPLTQLNRFPKMVKLVIDDQTCHYKLIVVGNSYQMNALLMEVYDSYTNMWESCDVNPTPSHIYKDSAVSVCGPEFSHDGQYEGLAVFHTKERYMYRLRFPSHSNMLQPPTKNDIVVSGQDVFALVGTLRNQEGLFKLWEDPHTGECQWVSVPVEHDATSLFNTARDLVSFPHAYYKRVFIAGTFILVIADNRERADHNHHQILMINDMAGQGGWVELPKLGKGDRCDHWELNTATTMDLSWDATP